MEIKMRDLRTAFRTLSYALLAAALIGCGSPDPVPAADIVPAPAPARDITPETAPSPAPSPAPAANAPVTKTIPDAPVVEKPDPAAAFKAACTKRLKARMLDPTAASIKYTPLSGEDGFEADVTLLMADNGKVLHFTHSCRRTASGDVVTKQIKK